MDNDNENLANQLYEGDCLQIMPTLPDKSIDMILCDLPYGTTACEWDTIIPFEPLWKEYKRLIKDNGAIVLMASQPFATDVINSNRGWFKYEWIWDKHISRNFQVAKYKPMNRHENVLVFGNGCVNYYPQKTKRDKPVSVRNYGNSKSNPLAYNDGKLRVYDSINPNTIIEGLWEANSRKFHPTQKPVALFEYLIRTYTNEGDTVLDNCAGSGTTGVACRNIGRKFILIEKDPEYFGIIEERIHSYKSLKMIKSQNPQRKGFFSR